MQLPGNVVLEMNVAKSNPKGCLQLSIIEGNWLPQVGQRLCVVYKVSLCVCVFWTLRVILVFCYGHLLCVC